MRLQDVPKKEYVLQGNRAALITLIRNRLNRDISLQEKQQFFHSKGISLITQDEDLYFLKADKDSKTDLSNVCQGLVFRGEKLICFHEKPPTVMKYSDSQNGSFIWNKQTVLFEPIQGQRVYVYWDPKSESFLCSEQKKLQSSFKDLILPKIYNIMSLDAGYTYEIVLNQTDLYLIGMYDNRNLQELYWNKVDVFAGRHKLLRPSVYASDKIEEKDLPIIAQDQCMNKIEIHEV